jgi:hypothetical protein
MVQVLDRCYLLTTALKKLSDSVLGQQDAAAEFRLPFAFFWRYHRLKATPPPCLKRVLI